MSGRLLASVRKRARAKLAQLWEFDCRSIARHSPLPSKRPRAEYLPLESKYSLANLHSIPLIFCKSTVLYFL